MCNSDIATHESKWEGAFNAISSHIKVNSPCIYVCVCGHIYVLMYVYMCMYVSCVYVCIYVYILLSLDIHNLFA